MRNRPAVTNCPASYRIILRGVPQNRKGGVRLFEGKEDRPEDSETMVEPDISIIRDSDKLDDYGCKGAPDSPQDGAEAPRPGGAVFTLRNACGRSDGLQGAGKAGGRLRGGAALQIAPCA